MQDVIILKKVKKKKTIKKSYKYNCNNKNSPNIESN